MALIGMIGFFSLLYELIYSQAIQLLGRFKEKPVNKKLLKRSNSKVMKGDLNKIKKTKSPEDDLNLMYKTLG